MSDVVHICNFNPWEVEAGEWGVQGLPMLHGFSSQEEENLEQKPASSLDRFTHCKQAAVF